MLIVRELESNILCNTLTSDLSEFVAVYGRRRVGKTFLVRETFDYKFTFQHSGMANTSTRGQLDAFKRSLNDYGNGPFPDLNSWMDAFDELKKLVMASRKKKKVIFIDEISWLDTPKSKFLPALEHFWNNWASARKDIVLVVCASATSWIIKKVLRNRGGLHNRVTRRIPLSPFTLHECEQYVQSRHLQLSRRQISTLYMVMGGVAFYWSLLEKGMSDAQNIDRLFFHSNAPLKNEFYELYDSLFKTPQPYIDIVTALGKYACGLSRQSLLKSVKMDDNGAFSRLLEELEQCGFIRKYTSFGKKKKDALYQLVDNFTLFYFKFMSENAKQDEAFWTHSISSQMQRTWCGLAFERLCLLHIPQIKRRLGIEGVATNCFSWHIPATDEISGAQIDLLIDRNDQIINLCEMKWSQGEYLLTQSEVQKIHNRMGVFLQTTKTRKAIHITMITPYGLQLNQYANEIQSQIVLDDLFEH